LTVYNVYETARMPTVVQSCRLEKSAAKLLSQHARRRQLDVSTLSSLYLTEKTREEEFPGIGFRDHIGGREAYIFGHRVAVWEVLDVYKEAGSVKETADHFNWPEYLVKSALDYAKIFRAEVAAQRAAEVTE
jgi:uncharacterized protein (DUF433 family)